MANREALRELQTRLARRLQAAKAEGLSTSWLAVRAGGANYLFPLAHSGEIFPLANLQAVPYVRPWFRGVVNLRGGLYGVIDLSGFVNNAAPAARTDLSVSEARVITLNGSLEVNCALLVDALAGLRNVDAFSGTTAPPADAPSYFGNCYCEPDGVQWQEINLQALSRFSGFLSVGV